MRILNLEVENFGIFTRRQFQFGDGRLALVYGANETGKSTLLQLLREVLFGFPHRDSIPISNGSIVARATMQAQGGRRLAWHRRKGRVNKLSGQWLDTNEVLPESDLEQLLCGASPELYQHVFAFSLAELQQGEKSLQAAKLTETLYGGGAGGLAAFRQIEAVIDERLTKLYAPRGSRRVINERLQQIRDVSRSLRDSMVKPTAFDQLAALCADAERERQYWAAQLQQLGHALKQLEARAQILPARTRCAELQQQWAQLQLPANFPTSQLTALVQALGQLASVDRQQQALASEIAKRCARRKELAVAGPLLEHAAEVLRLYADLQRIAGCRHDQPLRLQEAMALEDEIDRQLARWKPDWTRTFLRQLAAGQAELQTVREMAGQLNRLDREQSEAEGARRAHVQQMQVGEKVLSQLADTAVPSELPGLLEQAPTCEVALQQRKQLATERQRLRNDLQHRRRHLEQMLAQPLPEAFDKLDVPSSKSVSQEQAAWEESERAIAAAQQQVTRLGRELSTCQEAIQRLVSEGIPTKNQLYAARRARDEHWLDLRALLGQQPVDSSALSKKLDHYETLSSQCDNLINRLLAADAAVAEHEAHTARAQALEQELQQVQAELMRVEGAYRERETQWRAQWSSVGIEPLAPRAMADWLRELAAARQLASQLAELQQQDAALQAQCHDYVELLSRAVPNAAADPLGAIKAARNLLQQARHADSQRQHHQQLLTSSRRELENLDHRLVQLAEQRGQWQQRWHTWLNTWHLPPSWTPQVADDVLGKLFELKERLNAADALRQRVVDMQHDIDQFAAAARQVCREVAPDLLDELPENAVRKLFQRLEQTKSDARLAAELETELARFEQQSHALAAERARWLQELTDLPLSTGDDLPAWETRLRRACDIAAELRSLDQLLSQLNPDTAASEMSEGHTAVEPLEQQCEQLRTRYQAAEAEHQRALKQSVLLAKQLEDLDTQGRTNQLALELEQHRAELHTAVDQWVPLMMASALMKQCLEKFERERQPQLLQLASRYFQQMTAGRYVEIRRRLGDDEGLLVRQYDNREKEPYQLSTGTREQLYLSIRLAYVMQYCEEAEPLPLVMDDVLVNFDAHRARLTLEVLSNVAESVQILMMTCHESTARLVTQTLPGITRVDLGEPLPDPEPRSVVVPPRKRSRMKPAAAAESITQRPLFPPQ